MHYWIRGEIASIQRLNADFLASRESAELRAETLQMGFSLNACWRICATRRWNRCVS